MNVSATQRDVLRLLDKGWYIVELTPAKYTKAPYRLRKGGIILEERSIMNLEVQELKYKDYYDYLEGIHGNESSITYERICQVLDPNDKWKRTYLLKPEHIQFSENKNIFIYPIAIAGYMYISYYRNNQFYFGEKAERE